MQEEASSSSDCIGASTILNHRWRVRRRVGKGTFAEIWEASDLKQERGADGRHPHVAVKVSRDGQKPGMLLHEEEVLRSLPPTFLSYSLDETMKDQNEAMLAKMEEAGCKVSVRTFTGIHSAILWMTGTPAAEYYQEVAAFIQKHV